MTFVYLFQVLTGFRPFHHLCAYAPVVAILKGERPGKPLDAESLGFSSSLWRLVQLCWSEMDSTRPTARQLFDCICPASLIWVAPQVYPTIGIDTPSITDSYSSGSSEMSLTSLTDEL